MLIDSNRQVIGGADQVKLTPIDQSQMMQINQIMDEMHHSIKDTSGAASTGTGVQQIMLNGQPALFIPASAFPPGSNPMIQMEGGKQQQQANGESSISMSLDFSALLGTANENLNTSDKEDLVKYEPIDYEDEIMSQEDQSVGNQLCNLTNIMNNNSSQQSSQGVTLYQLPNGTLTTDPHAAMMASDTLTQSQQPQYLYLPLPFDSNMNSQSVVSNTQQVFMTPNGQIITPNQSQQPANEAKNDQNEYLLSGKKKTPRTGNTIAMALKGHSPAADDESPKKRCNKRKKFVDMVVDFKMNKLSTIISQNESLKQQQEQQQHVQEIQRQQQIATTPSAPIIISAPPAQPQFQLLPGQQVFCDQQTNQWYLVNGAALGGEKSEQSTSPKDNSKSTDKERQGETDDDDFDDLDDDDEDDDDLSDSENNSKRKGQIGSRRRKACDCANCVKIKKYPGKEAGKKRTHVCHKCPKEYNKTSHLRAHLRAHDGLRPYACDFRSCGKSFTRSDELKRHKRIHTDDRKFACTVCKKRFLRSDHLSKHVLIHIRQNKDLPQEVLASLQKQPATPNEKRKPSNAQPKIKTLLLADEEVKKNSQQHQQLDSTPTAITLPNGTTAFISAMSALNSTIFA